MQLDLSRPYKSFILTKVNKEVKLPQLVGMILNDLERSLEIGPPPARERISRVDAQTIDKLVVGAIHYSEKCQPAWTSQPDIQDHLNHMAAVCARGGHVAIFLSEAKRKLTVTNSIRWGDGTGLGSLEVISPDLLNAAFVQGPARTLWLSGTHRRTSIKADNKILSGFNLRDALDPLADQTFYFTAARCVPDQLSIQVPVGVSPRKSQVWLGPSNDWNNFLITVTALLSYLESVTTPQCDPLPILAVSTSDASQVSGPFDIALIPPEIFADDPEMTNVERQEMELWGYHSNLEVTQSNKKNNSFEVEVFLEGRVLGRAQLALDLNSPGKVSWMVSEVSCVKKHKERYRTALSLIRRKDHVKIWFESGHTICDGEIFEVRHRDMPFNDFIWSKLVGFNIKQEKPDPLKNIGTQKSLFDWVQLHWPNLDSSNQLAGGWLACDDGAMEMADFIHLDDSVIPAVLSLIHVKASGSSAPGRRISVSDYEVVTGQAVKNLRYLDRICLANGLKDGIKKQIGTLVWNNRQPCKREDMINALGKVQDNYLKRIYVLQPRLTKHILEQARKTQGSSDHARLRQLDTLLLSAAASCKGLGVDFIVIGEDA